MAWTDDELAALARAVHEEPACWETAVELPSAALEDVRANAVEAAAEILSTDGVEVEITDVLVANLQEIAELAPMMCLEQVYGDGATSSLIGVAEDALAEIAGAVRDEGLKNDVELDAREVLRRGACLAQTLNRKARLWYGLEPAELLAAAA